ncbi:MAG: chalcone isomerase family protein [Thermoanaerobaculaceae bacterium]|nr:chalcone isomerase family protein [Thermoanaerobaculaceae bacterium]
MLRALLVGVMTVVFSVPLVAGTLEGVTLPDTVSVNGVTLHLNGMGVRIKSVFKVNVYVAGLYLATPSKNPAAILAANEPRQLVMHFLYKEVEAAKLVEAWREGFANNSAAALPALKARLDKFCALWPAMKSGETATLTYIPGQGTKVTIKGKDVGIIEGKDFADAIFAVWLGPKPPNPELKQGLLGEKG